MSQRTATVIVLLAAAAVGFVAGGYAAPSATAGPAVVGGTPTHWFVTNSESGRALYVWAVTNGSVTVVSQSWIEERPDGPILRSTEIQRPAPDSTPERK